MTPQKHPSNNTTVQVPANWDDRGGQLRIPALHVTQGQVHGTKVFVSFWKPTPEELAMLLAGGQVQLTCIGGQAACNISAIPPNEQGANILLPH
jgi:hypothetical protein